MNQDILDNLIEEVQQYVEASKRDNTPQWTLVYEMQVSILEEAKKRISSLPSDTQWIDRLNNLKNRTDRDYEFAWESQRSYDKWQIDILEEILSNKN